MRSVISLFFSVGAKQPSNKLSAGVSRVARHTSIEKDDTEIKSLSFIDKPPLVVVVDKPSRRKAMCRRRFAA